MVISDAETAHFLQASCWERMATLSAEHRAASIEYERAMLEDFLYSGIESGVRLMIAEVALKRAEGRLERC